MRLAAARWLLARQVLVLYGIAVAAVALALAARALLEPILQGQAANLFFVPAILIAADIGGMARKSMWMERLVADLDREFPGMAKSVVHCEMAMAETMARYLNPPDGAVYGFAPEREGVNPLGMTAHTTIKGLWLASAYAFSGGFTGAMMGGAVAARDVIRATEGAIKGSTARSALRALS